MSRFIEVLEAITGKKVVRPQVSVSHDGTVGKGELYQLARHLKRSMWQGVKCIKGGKRLTYLSTNDLNEQNELYPDYLERREKRKKKENKSNDPIWSKNDWR